MLSAPKAAAGDKIVYEEVKIYSVGSTKGVTFKTNTSIIALDSCSNSKWHQEGYPHPSII